MADYNTNILISARDTASPVMGGIGRQAQSLAQQMTRIGTSMQWTGARMTAAMTMPITRGFREIIQVAEEWSDAQNRLAATTRAPVEILEQLNEQAREIAAGTRFSTLEVTEAQNFLAMAGLEVNQIFGATPAVMRLATSATMSLGEVADATSNILLGMQMPSLDTAETEASMTRIADAAAWAATSTNQSLNEALYALERFGPIWAALGGSVETGAAATGAMANVGFSGGEGARALNMGILRSLAPTAQGMAVLQQHGFNPAAYGADFDPTGAGLTDWLVSQGQILQEEADRLSGQFDEIFSDDSLGIDEQLQRAMSLSVSELGMTAQDGQALAEMMNEWVASSMGDVDIERFMSDLLTLGLSPAEWRALVGGQQAARWIALAAAAEGDGGFLAVLEQARQGVEGYSVEFAEAMMQGFSGVINMFRQSVSEFGIAIVEAVAPELNAIFTGFTRMINRMAETSPALMRIVAGFSILAAVMGPLLVYLGFAVQGLAALSRVGAGVGAGFSRLTRSAFGLVRGLFSLRGALIGGAVYGLYALGRAIAGNIDNSRRWGYAWSEGARVIGGAWDWLLATVEGDADAQAQALYVLQVRWRNFSRVVSELASDVGMAILETVVGHEAAQRAAESLGVIWGNLSEVAVGLWEGIGNFASALRHDLSEAFQIFTDDADSAQDGIAGLIDWFAQLSGQLPDAEQIIAWMNSFAEGFTGVLIPAIETAHAVLQGFLGLLSDLRDGLSSIATWFGGEGNGLSEWLDSLDSGRVAGAVAGILLLLAPLRRVLGVARAIIRVFASLAAPLRIAAGWGAPLITGLGTIASAARVAVGALGGVTTFVTRFLGPVGALLGGLQALREFYEWGQEQSNERPYFEDMDFTGGQGLENYGETLRLLDYRDLGNLPDDVLLPPFLAPPRPEGTVTPFTPEVVDSVGGGGRLIQLEGAINDLRAAIVSGELRTEIEGAANVNIVVTDGRVAATASSSGSIEANLANSGIGMDALMLAP